jgi:hypothetical protein
MPLDGQGTFRHNDQVARSHGAKEPKLGEKVPKEPAEGESGGKMTEVHDHGDGSFHTVHEGKQEEHETIGHMHAHLSSKHGAPGEKHFHAHHDGSSGSSHSVETGGEPEHRDMEDAEGMKQHLGESMGEEGAEGEKGVGYDESEGNSMGSLGGSALGM